jgi:cobalamin biosynthesis protein CobT
MRSRTTTAVIAAITCLALALVPGVAEARGDSSSKGKRHSSHGKKQQKRHAKARVKVLRTSKNRQYVDPTPATPTAGQVTVLSFTGGKLTLQHPDGTTAGRVTDKTSISCKTAPMAPAPTTTTAAAKIRSDDGEDDDAQGTTSAPSTTPVVPGTSTTQGDDDENENDNESGDDDGEHGDDDNESGDDDGEHGSAQSSSSACDQSALTAGALIRRARIEITNGVATFDEIELLRPAS